MGIALCVLAFGGAFLLAVRGLGTGTGFVLLVGCLHGWLRCRFYNPATHFTFDAALIGLYVATFAVARAHSTDNSRELRTWAWVLAALPFGVLLVSPFIDGQPLLIQLVGLRSVLLFIPALLVATRFKEEDVSALSAWALVSVFVATAFAVAEIAFGVSRFFPINAASRLIYSSSDAGPTGELRIPSSFGSSHLYGGTMVALLPLIVLRIEQGRRFRILNLIGAVAAAAGAFVCSARTPVLTLCALVIVWALSTKKRLAMLGPVVLGALAISTFVLSDARFRRYETLKDSEMVEARVGESVNRELVDVVLENPLGLGLASAVGTSIPYFLVDQARPQEGIESEFSRLAVELGAVGLAAWVLFASRCLLINPRSLSRFGGAVDAMMWVTCIAAWITGVIGAGILTAVPSALLLFIYTALVATQRLHPVAAQTGIFQAGRA